MELKSPKKSNWRKLVKMGFLWTWAEKGSEKRKFGGIWKSMVKTYYGKKSPKLKHQFDTFSKSLENYFEDLISFVREYLIWASCTKSLI